MNKTQPAAFIDSAPLGLEHSSPSARLPTVLIVEDQQAIAELLLDVLNDSGFDAQRAPSALDAAAIAREIEADVVLLDVMMPDRNGWDVLKDLRAEPSTLETR